MWPRWPGEWEVTMLGGWGVEVWAGVVHRAGVGEGKRTGEEGVEGRDREGVCCHGFETGERKRGGGLRERMRGVR